MTDTQHKPQDLTLYGIETSIVELLAFRDEIEADPDMTPAEISESLKACDEQIQAVLGRELQKVDGVAHVLMEMEARAEVAKKERDRLNERARTWQKRHDWLEGRVIEALQFRLQATGAKKLEGETSTLSLRKNPPSVEIRQPLLLPDDYTKHTLTVPHKLMESILDALEMYEAEAYKDFIGINSKQEPMKSEILAELKRSEPCDRCDCTGLVTVARELQLPGDKPVEKCTACGGTGKVRGAVPGCELISDCVRLVVE